MASMYLALGYQCNHHCFFCPCGQNTVKTAAASTEQLIMAIDQGIQNQKINHITISGGEPTCHPDFNRIISYCVEKGLRVGILSNGENFENTDRCRQLFRGINLQQISVTTAIHSDLQELFEKVTRVPGSYKRTLDGIQNLIRLGISVTVKQVISKWNYRRMEEYISFLFRLYGPYISLNLSGMDYCGMKESDIEKVAVSYTETGPYLERALDIVTDLRRRFHAFPQVTVADLPLCCVDPAYWGYFAIVSKGSLSQYSAPGKDSDTILISSNIINDCDTFAEACKGCIVSENCPGMWKTAYDYLGDQDFNRILPVL